MTAASAWRTPVLVLVCATLILLVSLGMRQTHGLMLAPLSDDLGWGREIFSFAVALQALVWGLATPAVGVIADRWGPGRVVAGGGVLYCAGVYLMSRADEPIDATLGIGFLAGVGMAATMFPVLLSAVARVTPERKRSLYLGIASAGGSSGMFVTVPAAHLFIDLWGWASAMAAIAAVTALIVPLAAAVAIGPPRPEESPSGQSLRAAIGEACGHRGFLLLTAAYFVCGFQTMFVSSHLPAMLRDFDVSDDMGAAALTLIGLFNVIGCFVLGGAGGRFRAKYLLCWVYLLRSAAMAAFFLLPVTGGSIVVFACVAGFAWLATVPLTASVVAGIFGPTYVATLYGFTFFSHQIGAFLGIWLGGVLYDSTGSYAAVWWTAVILGLIAALMHYPIDDRPTARLAAQRR